MTSATEASTTVPKETMQIISAQGTPSKPKGRLSMLICRSAGAIVPLHRKAEMLRVSHPRCHSFLSTAAYVSFFAQVGAAGRILVGELFAGNCSSRQPDEALGWIPCVTASGVDRFHGGALFKDLPANMLGCFIIGFLSSSATLKALRPRLNAEDASLAAFPRRWISIQTHSDLAVTQPSVGLRTGLCGSLTTFASWKLQMIQMLVAGDATYYDSQWLGVLLGLLIGTATAMASLVAGQHMATALSTLYYTPGATSEGNQTQRPLLSQGSTSAGIKTHRPLSTVMTTVLCLGIASMTLTLAIRHSGTGFWRKLCAAVLLAPLGAVARWQLASFNGRSWFPLGTFVANILACIISFTAQGVESRWTPATDYRLLLSALRTGFAGALSTVSTWVVEIQSLMSERLWKGYVYLFGSQLVAVLLGCLILGCFIRI